MGKKYISCCSFMIIFHFTSDVLSFNLNIDLAKTFQGNPNASGYFGYTTDFLLTRETPPKKWILVGAPTSQDKFQSSLNHPGALFKCDPFGTSSSCEQIMIGRGGNVEDTDYAHEQIYHGKDNGWLGASLAVGDAVLVCAPRWQNDIEKLENQTPLSHMNGICYEIPRVLDSSLVDKYAFLSKDKDQRTLNESHYYYHYMNGMMGLSVRYTGDTDETMLIGAPGLRDASGGIVEFGNNVVKIASEPYDQERNNDYFGYALTSGKFLGDGANYIALGGPRGNSGTGQVKIVKLVNSSHYEVQAIVNGEEPGSYFGSVLCAVDVGNTNRDVLVVGAPFYGNLSQINIDVNNINEDEGKVYVYGYDSSSTMFKELQQLSGSNTKNSRFGSAICSPGDINNDGALDIAIGAPFEEDGKGAIYVFNGYEGKFWHRPSQIIKASSIGSNLKQFGMYLSQFKMDVDNNLYNDLVIGAPGSGSVVMLKSNPTISMEVSLKTSLVNPVNVIQDDDERFAIQVCFKYTGDKNSPPDVIVNYTVFIDNSMTQQGIQERILAEDGSYTVAGDKKVIRGYEIPQCSTNYTVVVQKYRVKDIVTPVTFVVKYAIKHQSGTGLNCSISPCPVISAFDAKRQVPDADFFTEKIRFKKDCGPDNICETDMKLNVDPKYNYGRPDTLVRGPLAGFHLDVNVTNLREPSYGTVLKVDAPYYISYLKVKTHSLLAVSCSPRNINETKSILECELSGLDKPFVTSRVDRFTIYFEARHTPILNTFDLKINLETKSVDINMSNNKRVLQMKVESSADIAFEGFGNPELFVTSKTKVDKVTHRFDFTNNGPSILESHMGTHSIFTVKYPSVVIDQKSILKVSELNFVVPVETLYFDCGSSIIKTIVPGSSRLNSTLTYQLKQRDEAIDNGLNYNCELGGCTMVECEISPLDVKAFVTIKLSYDMDVDILAKVKRQSSKVESLSVSSVATASMPPNIGLTTSLSHSAFAKTDVVPAEQKKESVEWWVVLLPIVLALIVLGVVIFVFWKLGFFKRKHKEIMEARKKSQYAEPIKDKENLIQNGNNKEKEAPNETKEDGPPIDKKNDSVHASGVQIFLDTS
ncbi:integrin alpha pat-2-like isoform X2 [Mytilus californianus]|uniref:integrin alpha pat-2-like isoform X2 n=1 Tax=Mytilus californianus TaxID=6549 RepID=UPI002247C13A|nr:integrin alpha pat-2-like isoform X2 [Mytilus californianus]